MHAAGLGFVEVVLMSELTFGLADRLTALGWMMATAESCTGGLIAAQCTDLPNLWPEPWPWVPYTEQTPEYPLRSQALRDLMAAATLNLWAPSGLAGALTVWSILSANFSLVTDNWCDKPAAFMRSRVWSSDCLMWHELSQRIAPRTCFF
jgi:hypothetical protein